LTNLVAVVLHQTEFKLLEVDREEGAESQEIASYQRLAVLDACVQVSKEHLHAFNGHCIGY
jgi:hypothetical protein